MSQQVLAARVDRDRLREQIQAKYVDVAVHPDKGFHFHTGRPLAEMLGYADEDVDWLPDSTVESLAGTGNPFSMGPLAEGETVLDIGCGAGFAGSARRWPQASQKRAEGLMSAPQFGHNQA